MTDELDDYGKRIGIPEGHTLREIESKQAVRKGEDTDVCIYEQLDERGVVVAKHEVRDSTSIYPPFVRRVSTRRIN